MLLFDNVNYIFQCNLEKIVNNDATPVGNHLNNFLNKHVSILNPEKRAF